MATAPFNINQALPGDTDIVSQHPANARAFRDIVESWLLVNHDTNGYHARVDIPRSTSPTTPVASTDVLYVTTTGRLKIKHPDGTEEYVGLPPGSEIYVSGALPVGYLEKDGSAVSRSTFADLFAYLGTTFGAGDGSTTFNLPNDKGLVLAGIDSSSTRLDSTNFGSTPNINAIGGNKQNSVILIHNHAITDPGHTHVLNNASQLVNTNPTQQLFGASLGGVVNVTMNSAFTGITINNAGSATSHSIIQPTRIARAVIKY